MFEGIKSSPSARRISRAMLAFDAAVNSWMHESGRDSFERYERFSAFMQRFHVTGWKNGAVQLACEGLTLGLFGLVFIFAMGEPAYRLTSDDWLKKQDLAVTFLDRYGVEVGRRGIRHDDSVPLEQMPDNLIHAVLATEDRRFFDHFGIDIIGTVRAITVNARSTGVKQGGSSLTQQLAKNLFLTNERSLERKVTEAYLALWLEFHLTKKEILKLYLDRAYMGGGSVGVQAASEFYFGKSVRDISLSESAMLAGLFKAPTKYAPHVNLPAARGRANDVLNNMVDAGYLTDGQIYAARRNPATPVERERDASPDWYLDWAYEEVKKLADGNKLGPDRVLTVRTALDSGLQKHAEATIEDQLRQNGAAYHARQSAAVILEPNGAVRAIVGGRDYGASQFNRATDALRQPGSSFKPFVYLTALMTGRFKPSTIVTDSPVCIGDWCVHNYGGSFAGSMPLAAALARSLNTVAVKLSIAIGEDTRRPGHVNVAQEAKVGRARIVDTARKMGISSPLNDTVSLPVGADEVTVIDMASAYATFANGGKRAPAFAATEIRNSRGEVIFRRDRDAKPLEQVIAPNFIQDMVSMMMGVVENGTGKRAQLGVTKVAGKTGTTNGYKDAWFVGYTGNYVGAVWFGNDDYQAMNNMTGGTLPAQTWHDIMVYAHTGIELKPLPGAAPVAQPALQIAVASNNAQPLSELIRAQRPATLSVKTSQALGGLEELLRSTGQQKGNGSARAPGDVTWVNGNTSVASRTPGGTAPLSPVVELR